MTSLKPSITFFGAAGSVTGSNFLFSYGGKKILVDCGMYQGSHEDENKNALAFAYDPTVVDMLLVTHAHADHIGRIPKLVRDGFRGPIYSTLPTREIAELMFADSLKIMIERAKKGGIEPFYDEHDVKKALSEWKVISYHSRIDIVPEECSLIMRDAGHILGSAMIEFMCRGKKILFTGDLGNSPSLIIHDTESISDISYLVVESVYGDRNHEDRDKRTGELERAFEDVAHRNGVLMIPSFSLERTQDLLYEINNFVEKGRTPSLPVYVDSPLAIAVTGVFEKSTEFFNDQARAQIAGGDDIFSFKNLHMTPTTEESKGINYAPSPKVIIAGSGMAHAGRMSHHLRRYLGDRKNILLFVGYQAVGTLGRIIQDGAEKVTIAGDTIHIHAEIRTITGYSGHKDSDHLVEFVAESRATLREVYCVMGEKKSALFLVQKIRDNLGIHARAPEQGETVELDI